MRAGEGSKKHGGMGREGCEESGERIQQDFHVPYPGEVRLDDGQCRARKQHLQKLRKCECVR